MKRIRTITTCLTVILAASALAATNASATELLSSTATGTFKAVGGVAKLFGSSEVSCAKTSSSGTFENAHLGKLTIVFEGCKTGSIVCTGTKDTTAGNITFSGQFHLNLARSGPTSEPHAGILVLIPGGENIVVKCSILGNVELKGSVIGLLFKKDGTRMVPAENFLGSIVRFTSAKTTKQEDQEFLLSLTAPENELMTGQHLESNIFGGGFKESGLEGEGEVTEVSVAGAHLVTG